MKQCDTCGKIQKTGFLVSHSQQKSKRDFVPNLHPRTLLIKGEKVKVKICAKCLKSVGK